jgi:hypothetical protein
MGPWAFPRSVPHKFSASGESRVECKTAQAIGKSGRCIWAPTSVELPQVRFQVFF